MSYRTLALALLATTPALAAGVDEHLPQPWFKHGAAPAPDSCHAGVDSEIVTHGTANMTLRCDVAVAGFVGAMQNFNADRYLGRRVRFSALVKTDKVEGWGGIWMRVDDRDKPNAALATMEDRPIKGSTDWTRQSVVLDAGSDANRISFGFTLTGKGQIWLADPQFEIVGLDVPTTGRALRDAPANLELAR